MKATIDIPDALYRRVKARSATEGLPVRAVVVELFRNWLDAPAASGSHRKPESKDRQPPWLAITRRHLRSGMSHNLEAIRTAAGEGWAAEFGDKIVSAKPLKRSQRKRS